MQSDDSICYHRAHNMKTISITIDEPLLQRLDQAARDAHKTRSDLFRMALSEWLAPRRGDASWPPKTGLGTHRNQLD